MARPMIALRLFSAADASRQIDVRVVGEREELTIGRDASAGWALPDPDRALSRLHLKVAVRDGVARVTDTSTNGVTVASRDERLPRDEPVQVDLGERLELGPYVLLVERADHVTAPAPMAPVGARSPFASGEEVEAERGRRPDPFASALPADPLGAEPIGGELTPFGDSDPQAGGGLSGEDAWRHRDERRAGDWKGAAQIRDPGALIGSAPAWNEPPADQADERGFGFDTPFSRPMLRTPEVAAADLAIPPDWDAAVLRATPAAAAHETLESMPKNVALPGPVSPRDPAPGPAKRTGAVPSSELRAPPEAAPPPAAEPVPTTPAQPSPALPPQAVAAHQAAASSPDLLQAFCTGARLDPASFALEDQAALMQRLGAVYRHMVLGLSDVMGERTALKSEYRMVRTTIRAEDNNPLKWAPPQKVAAELLKGSNDGFLAGPDAVTESFQDIKKHLLCMLAGLRAALSSTLEALAPAKIEEAVKDQPFVLKTRGAVAWSEYTRVHAELRREAEDNADSPVNREFRAAYEKQLIELDRMASR